MLHALHAFVTPALMQRLVLLLNHLLQAEPVAQQRLQGHVGRRIELLAPGWPAVLPPLPRLAFAVTPAGLLEWLPQTEDSGPFDLQVVMDASRPQRWVPALMAGEPPALQVQGDAALAADVNWLLAHLRWDPADDLQRWLGPVPAGVASRVGRTFIDGLRPALSLVQSLARRLGER